MCVHSFYTRNEESSLVRFLILFVTIKETSYFP